MFIFDQNLRIVSLFNKDALATEYSSPHILIPASYPLSKLSVKSSFLIAIKKNVARRQLCNVVGEADRQG